jgi:hypothetical protein
VVDAEAVVDAVAFADVVALAGAVGLAEVSALTEAGVSFGRAGRLPPGIAGFLPSRP